MKAKIKIDPERQIGAVDPLAYGHFMCRRWGVAERGLHDPDHPMARPDGIRTDVLEKLADAKPTIVRWPGGCTGTTYHWQDGIGDNRPKKIDLHFAFPATYDFGTDEYIAFCREIGAEPMIVWAMGVSSIDEGMGWLEYCNSSLDTHYANMRRANGHEEPYNVKYWQIGNEMYGRHEIGHMPSHEYAAVAREWAKTAKRLDPSIKVIAVGGTDYEMNWYFDPLREAGQFLDYISMHVYWGTNGTDAGYECIVGGPTQTERVIEDVAHIIKMVRREKNIQHPIGIAFTEWNAWQRSYMSMRESGKPYEPSYRLTEALAVATFINVLHRQCRTVTLATVAQSLNVVGLLTVNPDGVVVEPVYWPLWMARHLSGPISLDLWVESDGTNLPIRNSVPLGGRPRPAATPTDFAWIDAAATLDPDGKRLILSVVNRHPTEEIDVDLAFADTALSGSGKSHLLYHDDTGAMNSLTDPANVAPKTKEIVGAQSKWTYSFKPHSFEMLELELL